MATMATYFDKLEKHTDLEVSIIRVTKINKVLKMIVKLNSIPRDEEFHFRQRSLNMLSNWKNILDSDVPVASADKDAKPATNGVSKYDETVETPKLETEEEKDLEPKTANDDTPMPDADADADAGKGETQPDEADKVAPKEIADDKSQEKTAEEEKSEEKTGEADA